MKPRNRNGQIIVYGDPTSTQAIPARMSRDEAQVYGWVVERADGKSRPTKAHPIGQVRWVSKPERPVDIDTAMKEVQQRKTADKERWEREEGSDGGVYDGPTFRTRNVYTGDVVMGDIL